MSPEATTSFVAENGIYDETIPVFLFARDSLIPMLLQH